MKRQELCIIAAIAASVVLYAPVVLAGGGEQEGTTYAANHSDYVKADARVPDSDITAESAGYSAAPAAEEGPGTVDTASRGDGNAPDAQREQLYRDMLFE